MSLSKLETSSTLPSQGTDPRDTSPETSRQLEDEINRLLVDPNAVSKLNDSSRYKRIDASQEAKLPDSRFNANEPAEIKELFDAKRDLSSLHLPSGVDKPVEIPMKAGAINPQRNQAPEIPQAVRELHVPVQPNLDPNRSIAGPIATSDQSTSFLTHDPNRDVAPPTHAASPFVSGSPRAREIALAFADTTRRAKVVNSESSLRAEEIRSGKFSLDSYMGLRELLGLGESIEIKDIRAFNDGVGRSPVPSRQADRQLDPNNLDPSNAHSLGE